jgi:oligosaccharide repeat unit polymerase
MGLENEDFLYGHVLALLGVLGVIIGWYFPKEMPSLILRTILGRLKIVSCNGVIYSAIPFLLLGLFGLIMFVSDNANIAEIVISGRFRSMEIQEGTGKYRYLSYMLISGGVILTAHLVHRKLPWYVALIPVSVVVLLFAPLGGRSRALIPFIAGLLILWYRRDQRKVYIRLVLVGTLIMALLLVFLSVGARYRGRDGGLESISGALSISSLSKYARHSIWVDVGHLHSLAAAKMIGPGVLGGKTFSVLLWPITEVLHLPGKSSGRFIFQELVSRDRKTGFNPSLIGDAYLNFGLTGVFVVTIVIGLMLKILYIEFRRGSIVNVLYVILVVYIMWIFFTSIQKYSEALVVLCFSLLIIKSGQAITHLVSE